VEISNAELVGFGGSDVPLDEEGVGHGFVNDHCVGTGKNFDEVDSTKLTARGRLELKSGMMGNAVPVGYEFEWNKNQAKTHTYLEA